MNWKRIGWLIVVSGLVGSWGWQDLQAQAIARRINVTYWVQGTDSDRTTPTRRKFRTVAQNLNVGDKVPGLPELKELKLKEEQIVRDKQSIDVIYVGTQAAGVHIDYVDMDGLNDLTKGELVSHVTTKVTPLTLGGHPEIRVPKGHQLVHPEDQERVLLKLQGTWEVLITHVPSTPSGHPKPLPERPGQQLPSDPNPPHQTQSSHSETGQTDQPTITPNPTPEPPSLQQPPHQSQSETSSSHSETGQTDQPSPKPAPLPVEKPIPLPHLDGKPAAGQQAHQAQPDSAETGPAIIEKPAHPAPSVTLPTKPTTEAQPAQPIPVVPTPTVTPNAGNRPDKPALTQLADSIQLAKPHPIQPFVQLNPGKLEHISDLSNRKPALNQPQGTPSKSATATVHLRVPRRLAHQRSKAEHRHLTTAKKKLPQTGERQKKWGLIGLLILSGLLPSRLIYRRFH